MKFCIQLAPYSPDSNSAGAQVFNDILEQAKAADRLGFDAVSVTEHHLMNILMMPAPLQLATLIAAHTSNVKIMTSVSVLPLHDMRVFAGEVVCADIFTSGRLMLGVGRGAFAYEMERFGVPMDETQARFNESLEVLQALLCEEEVSWDGEYYQFEPITIMPRPQTPGGPQMMMAVLNPEGIYHCTKRGFHIQTTPLAGHHELLQKQCSAFTSARDEMGAAGADLTLSLSRVGLPSTTQAQKTQRIASAEQYYSRFDNVFTGPGIVKHGLIEPLPRTQTTDELADSLLIATPAEMVDRLSEYDVLGVDRFILSVNFGLPQTEVLEGIQMFAEEVATHFAAEKHQPVKPSSSGEPYVNAR
ncbi:MAG: LLM class flavin-dependent oxidoreductase [Pseudomonadota bacterium]